MKVSLNWLKDYLPIEKDAEEIGKILTDTGLEVEHIEEQYPIAGGLKGLIVGKVVTCEKHPNADRLSVTTVDIGQEKLFEVLSNIEKNDAADAESRMRLRSIDVQMLHLMEDLASGRQDITTAIRSELNTLAGMISEANSKAKGKK